ncbi:Signal transduction histidine kinase [Xylanibacter ruminicola]|uniref:PAS domain-containing sensor histidine kinase n=1 Tax=Xylanibacter ruminicola TaxID=839 RepID=UPI0008F42CD5|nr:HAMP domain-containing sensor histidine kinase [Xylanibacter ruminicola]SFC57233.1 Signal transduction histidine kinase [Xylanibacter ruminicola]
MYNLLLYTQSESPYLVPALWLGGALLFLWLFIMIFVQRRAGRKLQTELVELEKVRQNNVESEFVLKAMKLSTWHIDVPTKMLYVDADFRDNKGGLVGPPEFPIEDLTNVIDRADAQRVWMAIDKICTGASPSYHEVYRVKLGKGALFYWEESYGTIAARDVDGNPTRIVGTSMRIDAQKQMEADLIAARNKAEESDRLKTAFLANMGHEIRTPLNAIVGFADLLPVVESEEDRNQLISEIQKNNYKLLNIIDGLVSMSKVEAEAKSLVKSQTNIVPVLQEIADYYRTMVDGSTVVLATQFPYPEILMNTDITKFKEIVNNLMQNAVKFTAQGSITLGFDLQQGDKLLLWVLDTGKGIAEEHQKRIFERFFKVDEYVPGTGLGLSVAKSHVESLGGSIGVDSVLGNGSRFWVELPLS